MQGETQSLALFETYMGILHHHLTDLKRVRELYTLLRSTNLKAQNKRVDGITKRYPTFPQEVDPVISKLRTSQDYINPHYKVINRIHWDVCSGEQGISKRLEAKVHGKSMTCLDKDPVLEADITADFSNPSTYYKYGRPDVIWTSPQHDLCDVLLTQAYVYAKDGVIAHVQGDYITNRPKYRSQWLENIALKGEVRVIDGLPIPPGRNGIKRCQWLLLFKTKSKFNMYFNWPRKPFHQSGMLTCLGTTTSVPEDSAASNEKRLEKAA